MTQKVDFKKSLDSYRASRGEFRLVEVPQMRYLMVDGHGDPNSAPAYALALEALYPVAYGLKFASKKELDRDYVVPPMEGLWWAEDMDVFTVARDKDQWQWKMMLMVPAWIGEDMFLHAVENVRAKRSPDRLGDIRLELLRRDCVPRPCIWVRSTRRGRFWSGCMRSSFRARGYA